MDTMLLVVTVASLVVAAASATVAWQVTRSERQRRLRLDALRPQDLHPLRVTHQVGQQRRLADTGLTPNNQHPAPAAAGVAQQHQETFPFANPTMQHPGSVATRDEVVRCRQALERSHHDSSTIRRWHRRDPA